MSSERFPGKVLAPFRGAPVILHVVRRVTEALPAVPVVVATSVETSDDPLVAYLAILGIPVFRGPLDDVFQRFRLCVAEHPCEWILRVSADSPLLDGRVLAAVARHADRPGVDLVTTVFPRTFPSGHNAELIRVATFLALDPGALTDSDREHVTGVYYRHPRRFGIVNVASGDPGLASRRLCVDTVDDLRRLEHGADDGAATPPYHLLGTEA
jgi:spore coat polysaccharide biosynthesis protein SpsF